ncbi:MAG TPA: ATP-binding protein [Allosphingosinicella sp.]|nr:ATP-binding protein [Allosphingosinicella sp.]
MRRLYPSSLLGQMLLLIGAALLVAQAVNFAFLLNEQQKLSLARSEGPAIGRFTQAAAVIAATAPRERPFLLSAHRAGPAVAYRLVPQSGIDRQGMERNADIEERLQDSLREARVPVRAVRAASPMGVARMHWPRGPDHHQTRRVLLLAAQLDDGSWLDARFDAPSADRWLIHRLLLATAMLFFLVFGAAWWIARRLARPLRDLTRAAEGFRGQTPAEPVTPSGPSDLRRAVEAFNAMNRRTLALLDEKDRMLGAIGHDLRTPLASLRIRAENMGPEDERERLVATVEEMAATLEDILTLARTGRAREPVRPVDLAALADAVVEELRELGLAALFRPSPRAVLAVQPNLLRRALRNLVDNALAYGGGAAVTVEERSEEIEIRVEDDGPGIPADRLADVLEPFRRLDSSRNRESAGAGLGLAIALAVAQAHGGRLELTNRPEGGLKASLILPK